MPQYASGVTDVEAILRAEAVGVRDMVNKAQLQRLLHAYSMALTDSFIFAIVTAGLSFVAALFVRPHQYANSNYSTDD